MQIWTIARYEILRLLRMRYVFVIQFLMPLLLIFILGSALSGAFKVEDHAIKMVKVDLVQADIGPISKEFTNFLSAPEIQQMIQPTLIPTREEAVERLKMGTTEFALIIPSDFSNQVLAGKEARWEMILGNDYGQNLSAQMVLRSFLDQVNHRQAVMISGGSDAAVRLQDQASQVSSQAVASSHVQVGKLTTSNTQYTAMQYYAASMLVMFLLYSGMSTALSLQNEKEKHTLARLNAMPMQEYKILLGKVVGNTFISITQAAVIITATIVFYGVDWGHSYSMLFLVCFGIIVASMSLAVLVTLLTKTSKAISTSFQMIILVMSFLSGGFTPLPDGLLQRLGAYTLNYWGMQSMLRIMLGSDLRVIGHHLLVLGCFGGGLLLVSFIVYRKAGYHE
ncbi:ABC transporter permease [Paenibacillus sp. HWE-109]|uniref:ABC transporter permease n=1 Tax=Paenibacillus sp. HWE-109 TaxID=1306526 RepID=UPI001EDDD5A5|nr:ABC transporter permease [Paenibacillus sp. HWE-109]UKS30100.1 ABC transporter permease [Paenibacillus sp. HWE-109]